MSRDIDEQIQAILNTIDHVATNEPHEESQGRRTLTIYIEVDDQDEDEQPPIIETTLHEQDEEATDDESIPPSLECEQEQPDTQQSGAYPPTNRQRRPPSLMVLFLLLALAGIGAGVVTTTVLVPLWTPSASLTIVTTSQQLVTTSILQVITHGTADPSKNQVPGRTLSTITMNQQKTILTTGVTHEAAQAAHGFIIFYNGATYTQFIAAGTVLTGAGGVPLVTDADAPLPAAVFPTFGQASVAAHAAIVGEAGNVRAADVYGACCRLNVSAVNRAFSGGQDTRTYQSVTPQDITNAATSSKTSLEQSIQAALHTQVPAGETLLTPLACTSKVTSDHQAGAEATQVTVTREETCTGTTYSTQAFTNLTTQQASQDAEHRLGAGYSTTGVQSRILTVTPSSTLFTLQVESTSLWTYPFSQEQQASIKALLVGMRRDRASATLLHLPAVQRVSITMKNTTTIPTDIQQIHLLFLEVS